MQGVSGSSPLGSISYSEGAFTENETWGVYEPKFSISPLTKPLIGLYEIMHTPIDGNFISFLKALFGIELS